MIVYTNLDVPLVNERGDTRTITLRVEHDSCDPVDPVRPFWVEEAVRIANEQNPPPNWPAGLDAGTRRYDDAA